MAKMLPSPWSSDWSIAQRRLHIAAQWSSKHPSHNVRDASFGDSIDRSRNVVRVAENDA